MGKRRRRDAGFLYRLLPVLFSLGMAAVMVVLSAGFFGAIQQRNRIDQAAREYLLVMETEGYLSVDRMEELNATLEEAGLCDICLDGTTIEEVSYGERISLSISGTLPQTILGWSSLNWELPVSLRLSSTAKQ